MRNDGRFRTFSMLLLAILVLAVAPTAYAQVPVSITVPAEDQPAAGANPSPAGAPSAPATDTTRGDPGLPRTGAAVLALALTGVASVLIGWSLIRASRRSPKEGST